MSELCIDLMIIIDDLQTSDLEGSGIASKIVQEIKEHIDKGYLIKERIEIELAAIHGKSGVYDSGAEYFDETYLNRNNVFQ